MILVTGATGQTGRALVDLLSRGGTPVRALVRDASKAAALPKHNVQAVVGDLGIPSSLPEVLEGVTAAYLNTAAHPAQVEWHGHFIDAARRAGVRHIVRHSVRGAEPTSAVKICRWHAQSECELEASGIAWTHLRPVYNMNNLLKLTGSIVGQGAFFAPMKDAQLAMVDARDVAAVAAAALGGGAHEGRQYLVTGPEAIGFAEAAAALAAVLARPVRYVDVSPGQAREGMLRLGMPAWYVDDLIGFYDFYSSGAGAVVSDVVPRLTGRSGHAFAAFARHHRSRFQPSG
ncbi:NAD(P)H-binding protein [Piscinibacter sp. XHJ-5]|uniref:NmrA family NAD(P)-binding protein n=1 Tax=Piscinibacter sp. XHJ-5 TaxID=3037797 RepID=UPI002452E5BE|nr:NAD(P)H-binding protein [Piscinibacter sp. XHJ-5]